MDKLNLPVDAFQLTEAIQILTKEKITQDDIFSPPNEWTEDYWRDACNESYIERLSVSSFLLRLEVERINNLIALGELKYKEPR